MSRVGGPPMIFSFDQGELTGKFPVLYELYEEMESKSKLLLAQDKHMESLRLVIEGNSF